MRTALRSHPDGLHLALMLALTFSTGVIDAVGFLGLDRIFAGNMTGNVVILGMAIAGGENLPVVGPIVALVCFLLGALIAGRALRKQAAGWSTRSTLLFVAVGAVLVLAAATAFAVTELPDALQHAVTGAIGLAMGIQAGVARHISVSDVTTVVVTSTMVGLAFDSVFGGDAKQQWRRRAAAIALIGVGAAVGALLVPVHIGFGMLLSAGISLAVAALGHLGRPHPVTA